MSVKWKGFEFKPQGCLLNQIIENTALIGIAYERSYGFYKDFHKHDRPIIVFPRASCIMEVRSKNPKIKYCINHTNFLFIPDTLEHDDESISSIYDTFAILPEKSFIHEVAIENGFKKSEIEKFLKKPALMKRSSLLNCLLEEYFFSRIIQKNRLLGVQLLEKNLIYEILKLAFNLKESPKVIIDEQQSSLFIQTIKHIESNLFSSLKIQEIVRDVGLSQASLFREFKKHLNLTPYMYIQSRRLEEAKMLIKTTKDSIGEIAILVGYTNFGAFTDAFKRKYKIAPSQVRKK